MTGPLRIALAALAIAASCQASLAADAAAPARRFDESRSFDRDVASRFVFSKSLSALFVEAMFAQERAVQSFARRPPGSGPSPNDVLVDPSCGCAFDRHGHLVDPTHCQAMHGVAEESEAYLSTFGIIDPVALARPLACFRDGVHACVDDGGAMLGGVSCCRRSDKAFIGALRDPHFALVAPATLAHRLEGLVPGRTSADSPSLCGFRIDRAAGTFSLPHRFDGTVARSLLYAERRYGTIPPVTGDVLAAISAASPPTAFEIARERITRLRFSAPDVALDAAMRAVPPSPAFRVLGASE